MPAPTETTTITIRRWFFTQAQVDNATIKQLAGDEESEVSGSWVFGGAGQTVRSCVDLDTSQLEGALTGAQNGDVIEVTQLLPPHPQLANGKAYEVTATRTVTS